METRKHRFSTRVGTSFVEAAAPSLDDGPVPEAPELDADRLRRPSFPPMGLTPIADGIRRVPTFGSPEGEEQRDQTRRSNGGDARSQVDLLHGGTGARAPRQGGWRDQSPPRLRGYVAGPAWLAAIPPLAPLVEARLNGFPGPRAVVPRHRNAARRRRVSGTSPTGVSDPANEGKPAYPRYNRGAGEGRCPFDPQQTRAPMDCAGGGVAPVPPVTAHPDG